MGLVRVFTVGGGWLGLHQKDFEHEFVQLLKQRIYPLGAPDPMAKFARLNEEGEG